MTTTSHYCVYENCGKYRPLSKNLSFFTFPTSDTDRLRKWIENSGNLNLFDLTSKQLSRKLICELHFKKEYFSSGLNKNKKRLVKHAVPEKFNIENCNKKATSPEYKVKLPIKRVYKNAFKINDNDHVEDIEENSENQVHYLTPEKTSRRKLNFNENDCTPTINSNKEVSPVSINNLLQKNKLLLTKIKIQNRQLANRRLKFFRLKQKMEKEKKVKIRAQLKNKPLDVQTFINMQMHHKPRQTWNEREKQLALSYYYKSPALYRFMRIKSHMILPAERTIKFWLKFFHLPTGVETSLFYVLKTRVDVMESSEKECVLLFDEMSIKKGLEFDKKQDLIEGFQDLGHLGRSSKIATHALVFMVRGLLTNWKIPISYYLSSSSIKGNQLVQLLRENIEKCRSCGLNVRCVVADQGANNRRTFSLLGVTSENPFFSVDHQKIYAAFDTPHLIKSIRNVLRKTDIFMDGNRVSWNDIRQVYKIDSSSMKVRMLPKITDKHINFNSFEKMSVKLAVQVLSKTMAAAIETATKTKSFSSKSAQHTATFIKSVNDIFDCLNSRVLVDHNPLRSALSDRNKLVENTLLEGIDFLKKCKVLNDQGKERRDIYCIKGFIQTINCVLQLFEDIKNDHFSFLLTNKIQQDPLENLFSIVRNRGGYNPNPSARQFRQSLQQCMHVRILATTGTGNCEVDSNEFLNLNLSQEETNVDSICNVSDGVEDKIINNEFEVDIVDEENCNSICNIDILSKTEECSLIYFVGYLVHKCIKKFNCEKCKLNLQDSGNILCEEKKNFLLLKDYGSSQDNVQYLSTPDETLVKIIQGSLNIFQKHFTENMYKKGILEDTQTKILNYINEHYSIWMNEYI